MANSRIGDRDFNPYDLNCVAEASWELRTRGSYLRCDPYIPPRPKQEENLPAREVKGEEPRKSVR